MARFDYSSIDIVYLLRGLGIQARSMSGKWRARCMSGKHPDKHPSWEIVDDPTSPQHGLHHCLSCKFGGTSVDLVCHVIGVTPIGAREWIRERAMARSLPSFKLKVVVSPLRASLFRVPREVIFEPLHKWVTPVRRYAESRGLTAEQVSKWGVGYALEGRLNGRIVFPTRDEAGRVVNYSARSYIDHPQRYLTPKESENPDDGAVYGEQFWPQTGLRRTVVITEGAINMLAVERAMPQMPVGALSGSHVSLGQVLKVSTFKRVVILTDHDPAGDEAAAQLWYALARHVEFTRGYLPKGKDPQTVSPSRLIRAITEAKPYEPRRCV